MNPRHLALALLIVVVWGFNFVVIQAGLGEIPPIFLGALRFILAAFPALLFIKRPALPFHRIAAFGLVMFALQFSLLFSGMHVGVTAGLASLVLQVHVFFTIALAVVFLGERPTAWQLVGAAIALVGIAVIAFHRGAEINGLGLTLIVLAAAAWSFGNLMAKRFGRVDMLGLVVWSSVVAWVPLLLLSLWLERDRLSTEWLTHLSWVAYASVAYIVYAATLFGFAAWNWLLNRYATATIAPFTLLVPVVGFISAALVLGEPLQGWKIGAAALVIGGLGVNLFGAHLAARFNAEGNE